MAKHAFLSLVCVAVLLLASCNQPAAPPAKGGAAPEAVPKPGQAAPAPKELADNEKPVEFITRAGTYKLFGGTLEVAVTSDDAGTSYTIKQSWGGSAAPQDRIKKGAGWFIYPESTSKLWVFTGTELLLWEFEGKETDKERSHRTTTSSMLVVPEIVKRAPDAVKARLPKEIKEKFLDK